MKVKIFDFEHVKDLENAVNDYLKEHKNVESIQYQTSHFCIGGEQIFSFSCMILTK